MSQSGAAHRISATGIVTAISARVRSRADWGRIGLSVRGPLLTLALAILFDQMARQDVPFAHPFPFLLLSVVYATYSGGLRPGIVSAGVMLLYAVGFLKDPGSVIPRYAPENAYTLLALGVAVPLTVMLVARLRDAAERSRAIELSQAEAERLTQERRPDLWEKHEP